MKLARLSSTVVIVSSLLGCGTPPSVPARQPPRGAPSAAASARGAPVSPGPSAAPGPGRPVLTFPGFDVSPEGQLRLTKMVQFQFDSPEIKPESDDVLREVRRFLEAFPEVTLLRIESHSDNKGSLEYNRKLASARALSVAVWLVERGIDCRRLVAVGVGIDRPIVCNDCPEERKLNRRIEFHVAMVRGEAPFGPPDSGRSPAGDPCTTAPSPPRPAKP